MIFLSYTQSDSRFFTEDSDQNFNAKQGDGGVVGKRNQEPGKANYRVQGAINRDPADSEVNVATKKICFREEKIRIFKFGAHYSGWMTIIGAELTYSRILPGYRSTRAEVRSSEMFSPRSRVTIRLFMNFLRKLRDNARNHPRPGLSFVRLVHFNRTRKQKIRVRNAGSRDFNMASHISAKVFRR